MMCFPEYVFIRDFFHIISPRTWLSMLFPLLLSNDIPLAYPALTPSGTEFQRRAGGEYQRTAKHFRVVGPQNVRPNPIPESRFRTHKKPRRKKSLVGLPELPKKVILRKTHQLPAFYFRKSTSSHLPGIVFLLCRTEERGGS